MKRIEVQGHSGCYVDIKQSDDGITIDKYTRQEKYFSRLCSQMNKQINAYYNNSIDNIIIPDVRTIDDSWAGELHTIMDYVYGKNFISFFEYADKFTIDNFIRTICHFVDNEINECDTMESFTTNDMYEKWVSVKNNINNNNIIEHISDANERVFYDRTLYGIMTRCNEIFVPDRIYKKFPIGICHGDLTFSNIIFRDNEYGLIDFLDSFIESPIMDIVKLRQDSKYMWSVLMYTGDSYDMTRYNIICNYIDKRIDDHYRKYDFYNETYKDFQLMNFLRILQYGKDDRVIKYLIDTIENILYSNDN